MRRMGLLGFVAAGLGLSWACSPVDDPFCPNGVWPFDGQTAVPLDTVVVVRTGVALPADAPPLDDTVTLTTANGRAVPFHLELRAGAGELHLVPDEPLEPHTRYELGAVDWYQLAEYPHWWGSDLTDRDFTITTFSTGSRPTLLEVHPAGDDLTFVVAFSEPVDLDSLEGRLWASMVPTAGTSVATPTDTGAPQVHTAELELEVELEVLGTFEGDPHLVWVQPAQEPTTSELTAVQLLEGGRSSTAESIEPAQVSLGGLAPLKRYAGAPFCTSF